MLERHVAQQQIKWKNMDIKDLKQEWHTLQSATDNFEKFSLVIKLIAISLLFVAYAVGINGSPVAMILACLWLQDAIWKTFQSRHENRLVLLEQAIANGKAEQAYQFNVAFNNTRPSTFGLIKAYLVNALRPTVAFPHVVLIVLTFAFSLL